MIADTCECFYKNVFFLFFFLPFFIATENMGNVVSKRRKNARPSVVRTEMLENETATSTATSLHSILVNQKLKNDINSTHSTAYSKDQKTATTIRSIGWNLDIDECIHRLLVVGRANRVSKSICFRNSEIVAICRAARQVFLNQPVKFMIHGLQLD